MVTEISISPNERPRFRFCKLPARLDTSWMQVAGMEGYERLLEVCDQYSPEAIEFYVRELGYGEEWDRAHRKFVGERALVEFLARVRKDMGL